MTRVHWPEAGITLHCVRPAPDERPEVRAFTIDDETAWTEMRYTFDPEPRSHLTYRYVDYLVMVRDEVDSWIDRAVAEEEQRERARAQEMCDA